MSRLVFCSHWVTPPDNCRVCELEREVAALRSQAVTTAERDVPAPVRAKDAREFRERFEEKHHDQEA